MKESYYNSILKYQYFDLRATLRCTKGHIHTSPSNFQIALDTCKPVHVPRSRPGQTAPISKGEKERNKKRRLCTDIRWTRTGSASFASKQHFRSDS